MTPWAPALALPGELRGFFANPRGVVVRDPAPLLAKAPMAVCVGDYVSRICESTLGPRGSSIVFDARTRRGETEPPRAEGYRLAETLNPPGVITLQAMRVVCGASREPGVAVKVRGEEDMLALVAIACAEPGSLVLYGLPGRGSVVVRATRDSSLGAALRLLNLRLVASRL